MVDSHHATNGFQYLGHSIRFAMRSFAFLVGARLRRAKIRKSNQFRLGVINHSLRSSCSRPTVDRQSADVVLRAEKRGVMETNSSAC